jgi:hypothetical protein
MQGATTDHNHDKLRWLTHDVQRRTAAACEVHSSLFYAFSTWFSNTYDGGPSKAGCRCGT